MVKPLHRNAHPAGYHRRKAVKDAKRKSKPKEKK